MGRMANPADVIHTLCYCLVLFFACLPIAESFGLTPSSQLCDQVAPPAGLSRHPERRTRPFSLPRALSNVGPPVLITTIGFLLAASSLVKASRRIFVARPRRPVDVRAKFVAQAAQKKAPVTLTGNTLAAALKMKCDLSGAVYSMYWLKLNEHFVVAEEYVTPERTAFLKAKRGDSETYAGNCATMKLGADSIVYKVFQTRTVECFPDAPNTPSFPRRDLANEFGITSVCMMPFQDGVMEYGTNEIWTKQPDTPIMPVRAMSVAFEGRGACYCLFWVPDGASEWKCVSDYVTKERADQMRGRRSDDKTFATESRVTNMGADSLVAKVAATKRLGAYEYLEDAREDPRFPRQSLAEQFGIKGVRIMLTKGGVLEYGVPADEQLAGNTLAATLVLRCEMSEVCYALYWVKVDGEYVAAAGYTDPTRKMSWDTVALSFTSIEEDVIIAKVGKTGLADFVPNAKTNPNFCRTDMAKLYDINSVGFMPATGGVIEYGSSDVWPNLPKYVSLPRAELKRAFEVYGANYVMIWMCVDGNWVVKADYMTPERERAWGNAHGGTSFCTTCRSLKLGDDSLVAKAFKMKGTVDIPNAHEDKSFVRQKEAMQYGVTAIRLVPWEFGVLEYGAAELKEEQTEDEYFDVVFEDDEEFRY